MNNKENVKVMLYGRARRIQLVKKIGLIVVLLIVLVILILFLFQKHEEKNMNKNFNMLRTYFLNKGYMCEMIEKDGGICRSRLVDPETKEQSHVQYIFTRYDEGFNYLVKSSSYSIEIRHIVNTYNDIILETTDKALDADRNKKFICQTDNSIVGNLVNCETAEGQKVKNDVYLGAVEMAISNLNNIINSSGYKRDKIINDYVWEIQKK